MEIIVLVLSLQACNAGNDRPFLRLGLGNIVGILFILFFVVWDIWLFNHLVVCERVILPQWSLFGRQHSDVFVVLLVIQVLQKRRI